MCKPLDREGNSCGSCILLKSEIDADLADDLLSPSEGSAEAESIYAGLAARGDSSKRFLRGQNWLLTLTVTPRQSNGGLMYGVGVLRRYEGGVDHTY